MSEPKVGRYKREFTDKQVEKIEELALLNCHTSTIAEITGIPKDTLKRHFAPLMTAKRAEHKMKLRQAQADSIGKGVPSMLVFLGKNDLDQTDRQDINLGGNVSITLEREKSEPQEADLGDNSD